MFSQVFMESVYVLHSLADLGSFSVAAPQQQVVLLAAAHVILFSDMPRPCSQFE